jgi:thioredoxin reductase (NADPH)
MARPAIIAVDDDREVLQAVVRDLRGHYAADYRVMSAESGRAALELARELLLRDDPVALFVVDQRMPGMTGVEFLAQVIEMLPDAKKTLLTAYADTEAAIRAINDVDLDHYIMKPWHPPEERLYPILDDLLDDWRAGFTPGFEGIRVIGHRWSRAAHEVKEFLARHQVAYRSVDLDDGEEGRRLLEQTGLTEEDLPALMFEDGSHLARPTLVEIADRIGLHTRAELPSYDLIVVGAGPSGLAAAVYGASEGLQTLIVERDAFGGQAGRSSRIENYLGFPRGISGEDLTRRARAQAEKFTAELLVPHEACAVERDDPYRTIVLADGSKLSCRALLIATGVSYRTLELPGAVELTGSGIYYGASQTEAVAHQGEDVFVVGGGNSAGQAAMYLSRFAKRVTLLVKGASLVETMSRYLIDNLDVTDNVTVRPHAQVTATRGDSRLESLELRDLQTGTSEETEAGALFVFIGQEPRTDWVADVVARDEQGFILSGADLGGRPEGWNLERAPFPLETSVPGIFVAGDVRFGSVKRVASATGEGAMAVRFIHEHLASL